MRRHFLLPTFISCWLVIAHPVIPVVSPSPAAAQDADAEFVLEGVELGEIEEMVQYESDNRDVMGQGEATVDEEALTEYAEQIFVGSIWTIYEDGTASFEFGRSYDLDDFGIDEEQSVLEGSWEEKRNGELAVEMGYLFNARDGSETISLVLEADMLVEAADDDAVATVHYGQIVSSASWANAQTETYLYDLEVQLAPVTTDRGDGDDDEAGGDSEENSRDDDNQQPDPESDGDQYESPTYGYTLTYDADEWSVLQEDDNPDDRYDLIALTNGTSSVFLVGTPVYDADEMDSCIDDAVDNLEGQPQISAVEPFDEQDAEGAEDDRAWVTYSYTVQQQSGADVDFVMYIECRSIEDGATLLLIHEAQSTAYEDEIEAREELLEGLEL